MQRVRSTLVLTLLLAAVVVGGFYKFLLAPKRAEAQQLQVEVSQAQDELDQTRVKIATFTAARKTFKRDYRSVRKLGKAVPNDDNVRTLVVQLDGSAKKIKVDFDSIELSGGAGTSTPPPASASATAAQATTAALPPGATVGAAGFPTMPFTFGFGGSFKGLSTFLDRLDGLVVVKGQDLEVKGRLLAIDAFSLEPADGDFKDLKAQITATAFLLPGASGGALNAAAPTGTGASTASATSSGATTAPPVSSSIGVVR